MIYKLLSSSILFIGIILTVNGTAVKANDLLASASSAVIEANISQFRTALDLYYIDHGVYPEVSGGAAMIDALKSGNYIRENAPLKSDEFNYQIKDNGQNYLLELKSGI